MHRHIEPALKAWQAAWASNPKHRIERPNPFGLGPLSADCIPLLDLAYVRLFVNMSRSKEKFWQRDFDGMAEEMSRGLEITANAGEESPMNMDTNGVEQSGEIVQEDGQSRTSPANPSASRREKHLRKAAFFAADSLSMSDKLDITFADLSGRELSLQSAMCAFDCAQVLAEWVATLQDRVGGYLGILGHDSVDYSQAPAFMLLEEEDVKLLKKIEELLTSVESKMNMDALGNGEATQDNADRHNGFAAKILHVTAYSLDKSAVWPVTHLTARCLETQATFARSRAERSLSKGTS